MSSVKWTYARAGVDREAIEDLHKIIISKIRVKGLRLGGGFSAISGPGGYAGLLKIKNKILALHIDGVGTKVLLAEKPREFEAIGIDAVAMNVNDILCVGAEPVAVMDYITLAKPMPSVVNSVIKGVKHACRESGSVLIGGETAVMPDLLAGDNSIDVAAASLGIVCKEPLPKRLKNGDVLIGLESSGLHSNGFSLVRRLLLHDRKYKMDDIIPSLGSSLREALLKPTRIYVKHILTLLRKGPLPSAIAHITGGGFTKTRRMLINSRGRLALVFDSLPPTPKIFRLIQDEGNIDDLEMYRTFNMGVGMVLAVGEGEAERTVKRLRGTGVRAWVIGHVEKGEGIYIDGRRIDK